MSNSTTRLQWRDVNASQRTPKPLRLFHIAYDEATRADVPAGFELMDHSDNERSDWREYWPIRRFLKGHLQGAAVDDDSWFGFFSPRFKEKTGLTPSQVTAFVESSAPAVDVVTFSPQADMGAFFLSPFEQEEMFQPGFIAASQAFLGAIGVNADLSKIVMDSRQIVFSNYFVAKKPFWRRWIDINEKLFALCEGEKGPKFEALRASLTSPTQYPGGVQRKVFLMERIASLILTLEPSWRVRAYNTFDCAWSATALNQYKHEAVLSDALKIAMREQGFSQYYAAFSAIRQRVC
ncbi:hypothetical protein C7S18_19160 [Ahniella affigens]|uniref:Uncharacterized protein n=1 Tax=Ahniella affigens TaxID=2021234 RepID=A0A2P1PWD1_9GAMM|nr:hypothetical protein [Ahniella affigens]AVP99157.1 hypothetical protein C7S18_19160 [Ahniella affigens]